MSEDELLDIVLFGTPNSWKREMERQGIDPLEKGLHAAVNFVEQIEAAEAFDMGSTQTSTPKKNKAKKGGGSSKKSFESKTCLCHGDCGHSSEECTVLKKLADAKRTKDGNSADRKPSGDWKASADQQKKRKQELAAFIQSSIKKGVKKELASKKRKSSGGDVNAVEEFDYDELANLDLDEMMEEGEVEADDNVSVDSDNVSC